MVFRILTFCVGAFLLMGCQQKASKVFLLPNKIILPASPIDSIERRFPLTYSPFQGFTGLLADSLFPSFWVLQEEQAEPVKWVLMDRFQQAELHASPVTGIGLEKIRGLVQDSTRICALVLERYPQCQLLSYIPFDHSVLRAWDMVDKGTGQLVGTLRHPTYSDRYIVELVPF